MAYIISYSNDGSTFQHRSTNTSPNVTFQTTYPDDSPLVDVNDIVSDYVMRIPLHTVLIMNSEDFLKDKNYRIAILEADTAVESLIYTILMNYYSRNENIPEGEFKTTFIKQLEKNRIDDNKQWLRLISNEITGGNQWAKWKSYCHDVRNDVIHHNKKPTKEEVETAISAAKEIIEVLKNHLYDADDWLNEGKAFSSNNELAIQYLWKSIKKKKSLQAYFHLGNMYLKNRDYESAIKYYEEALKFEDSPDCYFNIGRAYEEQEIYDLAMKNFDKAIDLGFEITHPTANPYHRKFIILTREGLEHYDLDAIVKVLKVLFEVFPNRTEICHNLIVTYNRKKDYDSALAYANTLIDLAPDNPHNYLERAIFEVKTGQKEKALDDIEKMASLDSIFKELVVSDPVFDILKNEERYKEILNDN
jgi:tetratricopeptide (TPR) repeat protein